MSHYNTDEDDDDDNDNVVDDDDDGRLNVRRNRDRGQSRRSQVVAFHFQRFGANGCTQGGGS